MAPARRIVLAGKPGRLGHRQTAASDPEIDRGVDFGIVEFHQHVAADDAERRGAESDERRHIEAAHANDRDIGTVGGEAQLPVGWIAERGFRPDTGSRQERHHLTAIGSPTERNREQAPCAREVTAWLGC